MLDLDFLREVREDGNWSNGNLYRHLDLLIGEHPAVQEFKVLKFTEVVPDKVFLFETEEGNFLIAVNHPLWRLRLWARIAKESSGDASIRYIPRMFH